MKHYLRALILLGSLCSAALAAAQATEGAGQCLDCHDYGDDSPVHEVLSSAHGIGLQANDPTGRRACLDCHGESANHMRAPRRNSPDVSFGPRWSASAGDQDETCLNCHEENTAQNWQHALHMHNNVTCVTCHDVHEEQDKVLFADQQAEVCTVCHKAAKQGIHGMERRKKRNPPCSECHNPHDHESAQHQMLANQSSGCLTCHDLGRMAQNERVSAKAKSYHKVMTNPNRTCIDCHEGVAHAPADSVTAMLPMAVTERAVTLFYPGMTDSTWLTQNHPGSQPLRQGANCQQCHRGEEASMGKALDDGNATPSHRKVNVQFKHLDDALNITISWEGPEDDRQLAIMWGDDTNPAYARGGCFAACHDDLEGMSRDRGQVSSKYLSVSREQRSQVGQPAILKDQARLNELSAQGNFAEIWQLNLATGQLRTAQLLAKTVWQESKMISVNNNYKKGRWTVELQRAMGNTVDGLIMNQSRRYTFGIALNGKDNPAGKHWVSLPMTLSFGGVNTDTDFTAE
ncbi:MAG: cytochrome c3 family protein [Halioglobus sp.]